MRGGCALKYFFQALQHVPSQNCPMSFPFTMLTLGSWRACGVWWADSPQATEVLNHHVFAPLKFHSAWAEIWSVKKLLFPSFQLRSWGKFWKAAKANWTQKSHGKNPVAEQCSGGSGNRLCRECLGLPGQARCWPAVGRGAAAPLALPSPPAPTVHFFSLCHPKSNHGITALRLFRRRSQQPWPSARERQQKAGKICPPHLERGCLEHRSALPLHSIPSLPLEKVTETFVEKLLVEQASLLGGGRDCRVSGSDRHCPSLLQRILILILCFKGLSVRKVLSGRCVAGVRVQLLLWKAAAEQPHAL